MGPLHDLDPNPNPGAWWRRRPWLALAAGALVLRLAILAQLAAADPLLRVLISDADWYDTHARAVASGEVFRPGSPHWLPPLYPWLLGGLYRLSGGALWLTLALQAAVGIGVTLAVGRLTARVATERAGLVAGWLWTLYLPVAFFETRLLGINVALPLCLAALHLGVGCERALARGQGGSASAFGAGLAVGLAALARPNLLLCLPGAGLGLILAHRPRGFAGLAPCLVAACVGLGLGLAPALSDNLARSGQPVLVSANGGINFWFGNNAEAHGTFHAPAPEWGAIDEQRDVSVRVASEAVGAELDERAASAWWSARGRRWILEHPGAALRLAGLKLADSLSSFEFGIQYVISAIRAQAPLLWIAPLPFGLLLALVVLGLARGADGQGVRSAAPLLGWIVASLAASVLFFTYSRFRLPWLPAAMPFCAVGALRLVDGLRGRAPLPAPAALALALLALVQSFVPFEGDYPARLEQHAFEDASRAWFDLGRAAREAGHEQRAARRFERALAADPTSAAALYELASLELAAGAQAVRDPGGALARLEVFAADEDARERNSAAVLDDLDVLHAAAIAQVRSGDPTARHKARALVEAVLARNPGHDGAAQLERALR